MGFTLDVDLFSEATISTTMKNCLQLFLFNYRAFVVMQTDNFFLYAKHWERSFQAQLLVVCRQQQQYEFDYHNFDS